MQTYSVDILHPKAIRLLEDLADLKLISLKKNSNDTVNKKNQTELQKLLLSGPTWSDKDYQDYLKTRKSINKIGLK